MDFFIYILQCVIKFIYFVAQNMMKHGMMGTVTENNWNAPFAHVEVNIMPFYSLIKFNPISKDDNTRKMSMNMKLP